MSSPPKTYPYSDTTVTQKMDPFFQQLFWGAKNSPGRILLKDASQRASMMAGVRDGDPKALEKYYGYKPTLADYANKGTVNPPGSTDYDRVFDPQTGHYRSVANTKPTQTAAQGGIVALRGFDAGGSTTKKKQKIERPVADKQTDFTAAQKKQWAQLEALRNDPKKNMTQQQRKTWNDLNTLNQGFQQARAADPNAAVPKTGPYSQYDANTLQTPFWDQKNLTTTNPGFLEAKKQLDAMKPLPAEYGQAGNYYNQAAQGFANNANYTPQEVAAQQINMRDAQAAQMGAVADISGGGASAGPAATVRDVNAINIEGGSMMQPADVQAMKQQYFQMDPGAISRVTAKQLQNFQMQGPGSWTDEGVAQKYMNPYMQGVIDISKRQKDIDYQKQVNQLNSMAAGAGAFGGGRQAMQQAQAAKDYQQQLQDLETQGMSQAYQQGQQQWTGEAQMGQQANIQNLQALLGVQSQQSQSDLQAALANQGIDYNAAVQNLQAKLGVQESEASKMLQAALANQQMGFGTAQTNLNALMQTQLANQGAGMQAQTSNQQATLQSGIANQQASTQTSIANMQAALEAAKANQMTQYNTGQFNAANQQQANIANMQAQVDAAKANQQWSTTAAIQNQQAGLTAQQNRNTAYTGMNNVGAGLGSLGNNIGAYNQWVVNATNTGGQQLQNQADAYAKTQMENAQRQVGGIGAITNPVMNGAPPMPNGTTTGNTNQRPY